MTRKINDIGLSLIKSHEGLSLVPYQDIGGVWTIGYGHTLGVTANSAPITEAQANNFLLQDLEQAESEVERFITVPLTDNQYAALVSLIFNVGSAPLSHTLGNLLNAGNFTGAASQFLLWDHCEGVVVKGLLSRRIAEVNLFTTPDTINT